jgi:LmbE family N-acetylglucosaminyl deacetylase
MSDPAPNRSRTVLAVFAHPDDESLACGGTLRRLVEEGYDVVLLTASRGERGGKTGPVRDDALGCARAEELKRAAAVLGIHQLIIGDHPDGDLQWAQVSELHAEILLFVRHRRPAAVITFGEDGLYWHRDHVGIFERTITAVRALGAEAPPLYHVTMARGVMTEIVATAKARGWTPLPKGFWSLAPESFGIAAELPTLVIDVSAQVPRKLAAILCHHSQMGEGHPFSQLTEADAVRLLGREYFHRLDQANAAATFLEQLCIPTP